MKDPTQLYNFNYFKNTKKNYIQQCTTVNGICLKENQRGILTSI